MFKKLNFFKEVGDVALDALPTTNIVIPEQLQNMVICNEIIAEQRMIVFCSAFGLDMLQNYRENISIDGTFEVKFIHFYIYY